MAGEKLTSVLIVDDIAETRENIRKLLQFDANIEVVGASSNGLEAIDLAIELQPDVVLMDINMPEMDGITLIQKLRGLPKYHFRPILVLSTESTPEKKSQGKQAGATGWIVKPFDPDELLGVVKKVLPH